MGGVGPVTANEGRPDESSPARGSAGLARDRKGFLGRESGIKTIVPRLWQSIANSSVLERKPRCDGGFGEGHPRVALTAVRRVATKEGFPVPWHHLAAWSRGGVPVSMMGGPGTTRTNRKR